MSDPDTTFTVEVLGFTSEADPEALAGSVSEFFGISLEEGRRLVKKRPIRVKRKASAAVAREDPESWRAARLQWEKSESTVWEFGDIPARVKVTEQAGVPVFAFPTLVAGESGVALRLLRSEDESRVATRRGLGRLLELHLRYELAWLEKELRALRAVGCAVLLVSSELDEILALADRVIVMNQGRITGELPIGECDETRLGVLMTTTAAMHGEVTAPAAPAGDRPRREAAR